MGHLDGGHVLLDHCPGTADAGRIGWCLTPNQISPAEVRALKRAARAWLQGQPHRALEIVHEANPGLWRGFQAGMLDHARERYQRRMGIAP